MAKVLFGAYLENIKLIEKRMDLSIEVRGTKLTLSGGTAAVTRGQSLIEQLGELIDDGYPLYPEDVDRAATMLISDKDVSLRDIFLDTIFISSRNKAITPKSMAQKRYIDSIRKHDIVFGIGPAGTGKTYLAMSMAVAALNRKEVQRIILARPAVEAGERLGFLPGTLLEKVNPYLRPLYDALNDMMEIDRALQLVDQGIVEVAPLAFMRGRTLNDSFVILDEAQNTTPEQMKMFLTRLGYDSKTVITGDVTQIDLAHNQASGLVQAQNILQNIEGIDICTFSDIDVIRHPLVRKIIRAYEAYEEEGA